MTLTLRSKTPVRFEWGDGVAETTVTLQPDDSESVLLSKLERVVELAGGQLSVLPRRAPGAALAATMAAYDPADRFDAEGAERALMAQSANGWNADIADGAELPEV